MSVPVYCVMIYGHIVTQSSSFVYVVFVTVQYYNCTARLWQSSASICNFYRMITCRKSVLFFHFLLLFSTRVLPSRYTTGYLQSFTMSFYSDVCGVLNGTQRNAHECTNMGKVKRHKLWWRLYVTWLPVRDLENFRPMDFCWSECMYCTWRVPSDLFSLGVFLECLKDPSEEVCDAEGVYVKLQDQG